jgi:hypothetical protein
VMRILDDVRTARRLRTTAFLTGDGDRVTAAGPFGCPGAANQHRLEPPPAHRRGRHPWDA